MKAIVVIDMPESCDVCPCYYKDFFVCRVAKKENENWYGIKPNWCPLKPMPEPKDVEVNGIEDIMHTEYSIEVITNKCIATTRLATDKLISLGWNACLDEIGEEDEQTKLFKEEE